MLASRNAITKLQGITIIVVIIAVAFAGVYLTSRPSAPQVSTQTTEVIPQTTSAVVNPTKIFTIAEDYDYVTDLDPAYSFSGEVIAMSNVYEGLLLYTGGTPEVKPALATSYNVSADGLTWTFKLREGVKFHDGTAFNATAVKYSFDRITQLGAGAAYIWGQVKELKIIDDYTVQYVLSASAPLQRIVASCYGAWIYSPNINSTGQVTDLHAWFNAGHDAGTGPYTIHSFAPGTQMILNYFPDYWGGWGGPNGAGRIATVVIKIAEDPATRVQMIESGSVQYAASIPSEERKRLQNETGIQVNWESTYQTQYAFLNMKSPYLKNTLIRKALLYAFPYQDYIKVGEGEYIQPIGVIPHGMWGHFDDLPTYQLNLTRAKQLLAEAGYPNGGFTLSYYYISGVAPTQTAAEMWKAELRQLGINLDVREMTWPDLWALIQQGPGKYNYDIVAFAWWPTYITPYDFMMNMWHTEKTALWNAGYYYNSSYDALIDQAFAVEGPHPDQALSLYRQAQQMLIGGAITMPLEDLRLAMVMRSNVQGFQLDPAYGYDTIFYYDVWLQGS
ncbi:MAG: ABC transporter substrate-binding protein [Candidatus Bathyarchaeia archaeon]